jgi:hypothetical protein
MRRSHFLRISFNLAITGSSGAACIIRSVVRLLALRATGGGQMIMESESTPRRRKYSPSNLHVELWLVVIAVALCALTVMVGSEAGPTRQATPDRPVPTLPLPSNIPPIALPSDIPPVPLPSDIPPVQLPSNIPTVQLPSDVPPVQLPSAIPPVQLPSDIPPISLPSDIPAIP